MEDIIEENELLNKIKNFITFKEKEIKEDTVFETI